MDSPATIIRVKALQPQRRRAGMLFTREARDLAPGDLGEGVDAAKALLALISDPQLAVTAIDAEGNEHKVTAEMIAELGEELAEIQAVQAELDAARGEALAERAAVDGGASDTAGPQDGGDAPVVEAPQAAGPDAGADDSSGSAAGAANPAQVTEPDPKPARPPAAKKPAGRTRSNGAGGKSAGAGD